MLTSSNGIVNIKQFHTLFDSSVRVWWVKMGLIVVDVVVAVREGVGIGLEEEGLLVVLMPEGDG